MKELLTKIKNNKIIKRATCTFIAAQGYATLAFAAPKEDGKNMLLKALELITDYAVYAGALVLAFGLIALAFSFKSQNSEGQMNAITFLVTGAILVSIKAVLTFVGVI